MFSKLLFLMSWKPGSLCSQFNVPLADLGNLDEKLTLTCLLLSFTEPPQSKNMVENEETQGCRLHFICFFSGVIFSQTNCVPMSGSFAHCLKPWYRIFLKQWGGECTEVVSQSDSKITLWRLFLPLGLFCYFLTCKSRVQASGQMKWEVVCHVLITVTCKSAQFLRFRR